MLEARERVLYTDAQCREALIVLAALLCDCCTDSGWIELGRAEAALDAIIRGVCHVSQEEEIRLQVDRSREIQRSRLRATARTVAHVDVAEAS